MGTCQTGCGKRRSAWTDFRWVNVATGRFDEASRPYKTTEHDRGRRNGVQDLNGLRAIPVT